MHRGKLVRWGLRFFCAATAGTAAVAVTQPQVAARAADTQTVARPPPRLAGLRGGDGDFSAAN
jgi:hypothetical protein